MIPQFSYIRVSSTNDAVAQLSEKGSKVFSGGTDLLGCLRDGVFSADKIVSISRVNELMGFREASDGGLRIGALTTITDVAENPIMIKAYPGIAEAASNVASPQLRNQGTLGGNLCQKPRCWYYRGDFICLRKGGELCYAMEGENQYHAIFGHDRICAIVHPSDTAPALIAAGALVKTQGTAGSRTIPLEQFFVLPKVDVKRETILNPDEIITEVVLPKSDPATKSSYRKIRARRSWDFALVGGAFSLAFKDGKVNKAAVVLSGVAPIPWRAKSVEDAVLGRKLDASTIAKAAETAVHGADSLGGNDYKSAMLRGMVEEELTKLNS